MSRISLTFCLVDAGRGAGLAPGRRSGSPWYQALIGGDGWAIELSLDELAQLKSLCGRLQDQHLAIADQLMAEKPSRSP